MGHEADYGSVARARCGWVRPACRGPKGKAVAKLLPTAIKRAAAYSVQTVFTSVDAVRLAILSVLSIFDCQSALYSNC